MPSAGKYERVFDAINRHAYAATTRLVGNDYARAKEIADAVRATCAAGMVPMLDTEVVTAAVAYLRGRDERRRPLRLDDIAVQLAWHADDLEDSDELYQALYGLAEQVLAIHRQTPAVSSQEETKEGEIDGQA